MINIMNIVKRVKYNDEYNEKSKVNIDFLFINMIQLNCFYVIF